MRNRPFPYIFLSTALLFSGCASYQGAPTIGSLPHRDFEFEQPASPRITQNEVVERYRQLLDTTQDNTVRGVAMRRVADLELEIGELDNMSDTPAITAAGMRRMQSAIELYNANLNAYPLRSTNDLILYQLAKAYTLVGEPDKALNTMNRLVESYPSTRYLDEIQFRRAELFFAMRDYPSAAGAYATVVKQFPDSIYFEKALYKLGWSHFKQEDFASSLNSYIQLLDRKMTAGLIEADQLSSSASHAEHELLSDTLRATSLSFSYQEGPRGIQQYFSIHGSRRYEPLLYRQLGSLYTQKERYTDAAEVYLSYVSRYPESPYSPRLHTEAINAYEKGGFPELVLTAKEDFVHRYGVDTSFWIKQSDANRDKVKPLLTQHIRELAAHYHTIARKTKADSQYQLAARWYSIFIQSFPKHDDAANMNFLLAEVLYDGKQFSRAVTEYENSAYNYPSHPKAAESGYAALLTYDILKQQHKGQNNSLTQKSITSALRFCDSFPHDTRVPSILVKTSEELYSLNDYTRASATAQRFLSVGKSNDKQLNTTAWTVVGHSQFELNNYTDAENAYISTLSLIDRSDKRFKAISDRLAASIYKQGEQQRNQGNYFAAAGHFMRVGKIVPDSPLRATAQYDAAALHIQMNNWTDAIVVLEDFRRRFPNNTQYKQGVTEKLATAYIETGDNTKAANEMLLLAATTNDKDYRRKMMLQAASTYEKAGKHELAVTTYKKYLKAHPRPVANAIEAQHYLAVYYRNTAQVAKQAYWLNQIIKTDKDSGRERSDRTRYLAALSALELSIPARSAYEKAKLTIPLKRSLKNKKALMQKTIKLYEQAIKYNVADITTEATYHLAEVYNDFAKSLMTSQRPRNLSSEELEQYEILLEEQAYPFEEKAIDIHVANMRLTRNGIYDSWIKDSHKVLKSIQPVRYDKNERAVTYVEIYN